MLKNGGTLKEVFMKARVLSLLTAGAVMTGLLTGCSGGTKNVEACLLYTSITEKPA